MERKFAKAIERSSVFRMPTFRTQPYFESELDLFRSIVKRSSSKAGDIISVFPAKAEYAEYGELPCPVG